MPQCFNETGDAFEPDAQATRATHLVPRLGVAAPLGGSGSGRSHRGFFDHLRRGEDGVSSAIDALFHDLADWLRVIEEDAPTGGGRDANEGMHTGFLSQPVQTATLIKLINGARRLPPVAQTRIDVGLQILLAAIRQRLVRAGVSGPLANAEAALLMSELFGSALLARALDQPGSGLDLGRLESGRSLEPSSHVH